MNKGREMETRKSYQYPKGEFRFPLIPDDDREIKKHPSMRKRIETGNRCPNSYFQNKRGTWL